jgi:hypothetical protein
MTSKTRRWGRLRAAPVLLIVLAITTGWGQPAAPGSPSTHVSAGHRPIELTQAAIGADSGSGPQGRVSRPERAAVAPAAPVAVAAVAAVASTSHATAPPPHRYAGQNHFWFPALGISGHVYSYPCSRTRAPDNLIYRWGCAGRNNVYILGHAYGVMKPLHDAYVSGRLHTGMIAIYADGRGHVHRYRIVTWRLVLPTNAAWAEAAQSVPSMTLQTCVGAQSQWRLVVRLVATT